MQERLTIDNGQLTIKSGLEEKEGVDDCKIAGLQDYQNEFIDTQGEVKSN
jgi:hypothetical protein